MSGSIRAVCPQCGSSKNFYFRMETWTYELDENEIPITVKVPYCRKCKVMAISNTFNKNLKKQIQQKAEELGVTVEEVEKQRKQRNDEEFFYEKY